MSGAEREQVGVVVERREVLEGERRHLAVGVTDAELVDDALYQLSFPVPDRHGREIAIEVGVHLLWREPAHAPGQYWAGFRFLTLSATHREALRQWISTGQTS